MGESELKMLHVGSTGASRELVTVNRPFKRRASSTSWSLHSALDGVNEIKSCSELGAGVADSSRSVKRTANFAGLAFLAR